MSKISMFLANLFLSTVRLLGLIILSVVMMIAGAIWSDMIFNIGLAIAITNVIVVFLYAIHLQRVANYRPDDDPAFNEMMDKLRADPMAFMAEVVGAQEVNKNLHGEDLLALSDDDLFETIYLQNLDIAGEAEDEEKEIAQFSGARRTVYILGLFDAEIQNGGLCQFFVNSSRVVAPYVGEALKDVGADEHQNLFDTFVTANNIDVSDLESFKIFSIRGFKKQSKRFDFDSFDDQYYKLPALQENVVEYIKKHINEF